ncbi:MAG: zf-HC2 domain-containing protein [Candidatus Acidiferrum sp.]
MSCTRMENRIVAYVDGRLKESERLEVKKHLTTCATCQLRVNEFRAVAGLLEELPQIEPSTAFDVRVRARVAAEPVKRGWWAWLAPSPRVVLAASMLVLATVWVASRPPEHSGTNLTAAEEAQINQDLPELENFDVISDFGALTDLPQPVQAEDAGSTNQDQNQNQQNQQDEQQNQNPDQNQNQPM